MSDAVAITNNSRAPQGVWSETGLVFIQPGQTLAVVIAADYAERVTALPFLEVKAGDALSDDELDALTAPDAPAAAKPASRHRKK